MAVIVSLGRLYTSSISSIFLLCMESNALEKSTYKGVALRFFAQTPVTQWIVRICDVVGCFLQKPF